MKLKLFFKKKISSLFGSTLKFRITVIQSKTARLGNLQSWAACGWSFPVASSLLLNFDILEGKKSSRASDRSMTEIFLSRQVDSHVLTNWSAFRRSWRRKVNFTPTTMGSTLNQLKKLTLESHELGLCRKVNCNYLPGKANIAQDSR